MSKQPWKVSGVPWKTESSFWVWVRGILRKGWSRHPVKIEYIKVNRKRIKNPNDKSIKKFPEVWGMTCSVCRKDFPQGEIEIDHKGDNATFTGLEDTESYVKHLYLVDFDSLREVCRPCHKIISHSQNMGVSFEEAALLKEVIEICKQPTKDVIAFIEDYAYNESYSNGPKRRVAVEAILRGIS